MWRVGSRSRLAVAVVLVGITLAACGGGGSGNGTAPASGSSGDPPVAPGDSGSASIPDSPPPLVPPNYDGATGAVDIGKANAGLLALEMMIMVQNSVAFAYAVPQPPSSAQTIAQTNPGPHGGQVVIQGRGNVDGTGWITADYQNYEFADSGTSFTYDGTIQIRYGSASTGEQSTVTVDLANFTISTSAASETFTGTVAKTSTTAPDTGKATTTSYLTDIAVFDNTVKASLKADYRIEYTAPDVTISGKLFDSRLGYVTVASVEPMPFNVFDGSQTPAGGGSIALTGSGGNDAILAALNHYFGSIGMDADGDGLAEDSTRIDWQAFDLDTTSTLSGSPQADAVSPSLVELGKTAKLDGRYSYSPNANFLHFNWRLIAAPAGSAVELSNQHSPVATFVPDVAGDYLFRLEVSGPAGSSADALVVQGIPEGAYGANSPGDPVAEAGPDRTARIGTKVPLDARSSIGGSGGFGIGTWSWNLYPPPDSQAVLDNMNATQPAFTPDVAGYYSATLMVGGCCVYNQAHVIIDAGGPPVHFDPAVGISPQMDASVVAVGDLNDDGLTDVVVGSPGASQSVIVIYGRGNGHFSPPVNTPVGNSVRAAAIKDINGDGLMDLVTLPLYGAGLDYRLQQPDGTLAPDVHVNDTSGTSGCSGSMLLIAKLFNDMRNSVLAESCGHYVMVYPPVAGGAIGAPVAMDVGVSQYSGLAVGDVTGDGIVDLEAVTASPANELLVIAGQADGTFAPAVVYPIGQSANHIDIGDLNGDGRNDVALSNSDSIDILLQQSDGSLLVSKTLPMTGTAEAPAIGDINGDGRADLIAGEEYFDPVNGTSRNDTGMFIQGADGSLSREYLYPDFFANEGSGKIIVDLNGDGVADMLTFGLGELKVMYGDPLGSGQAQTLQTQVLERSPAKSSALRAMRVLRLPQLHLQL